MRCSMAAKQDENVAAKPHMTGMYGVYLVAAELTKRGLVVSPTSRSAFGADLLVTDGTCKRAWSVQVKTNFGRPSFWLLNAHAAATKSKTHLYVLVNLGQKNAHQRLSLPDFYVVPSDVLARRMRTSPRSASTFYSIHRKRIPEYKDKWQIFGQSIRA